MKQAMSLLVIGTICAAAVTTAGEKQKLPDPTPRKDAILKRFVEEFVVITPGKGKFPESFMMGTDKGGHDNERPAHKVTFKYSFAMAKYEVTQELYHVVVGSNPAKFQGLRNGIDRVNWDDANAFCEKATKLMREAKLIKDTERIRLPSEAEWEYCCRAGTTTKWSFGDDEAELGKYSWYKDNSAKEDPPVGKKLPNAWGLFDMHGYVWEWCLDAWHSDYNDAPTDGGARVKAGANERVLRGGAYPDPPDQQRSAFRNHAKLDTKTGAIGFRCVKDEVRKNDVKKVALPTDSTLSFSTRSNLAVKKSENSNPKVIGICFTCPEEFLVTGVNVGTSSLAVTDKLDNVQVFEFTVTGAVDGVRKIEATVGTNLVITMSTKKDFKKIENPNSKVVDIRPISKSSNEIHVTAIGVGNAVLRMTDVSDNVDIVEFTVVSSDK